MGTGADVPVLAKADVVASRYGERIAPRVWGIHAAIERYYLLSKLSWGGLANRRVRQGH